MAINLRFGEVSDEVDELIIFVKGGVLGTIFMFEGWHSRRMGIEMNRSNSSVRWGGGTVEGAGEWNAGNDLGRLSNFSCKNSIFRSRRKSSSARSRTVSTTALTPAIKFVFPVADEPRVLLISFCISNFVRRERADRKLECDWGSFPQCPQEISEVNRFKLEDVSFSKTINITVVPSS